MKPIPLIMSGLALLISALSPLRAAEKPIEVDFSKCVIVVESKRNDVVKYATEELRDHIKLVSGVDVPVVKKAEKGTFPIYVGILPPGDTQPLADEEARWLFTNNKGLYLYGKDKVGTKKGEATSFKDAAIASKTQAGTLFAVYEFLENNLGIKWIEPGPDGIAYTAQKTFTFTPGTGSYIPQLAKRHMRTAYKDDLRERALNEGDIPKEMQFSEQEIAQRSDDEQVWRRRMRMGASIDFTYGHAFTKWWAQYGQTHPEYFALNKNGKRAPISSKSASRIKMCVSNPALIKQIVDDHFAKKGGLIINACENDSRDFCTCENCKALDVVLPGEENLAIDDRILTDRYVHFANAVLREARKQEPKAQVVFYAYSRYNYPPRREKLDDGIILFLLPNMAMTATETDAYYTDWKKANADITYLRPNDLCQDTGLPLGFEEHMFNKYKQADDYLTLRGTDYDTCWGFWPTSGIANYVMARAFYQPKRSLQDWDNEYFGTFGAAKDDIAAYYRYWRQIFNKRVMGNFDRVSEMTDGYKLLRAKMTHLTGFLYSEEDFDKTDAMLKTALTKKLSAREKAKIENLQLANQHNRLKFRAVKANQMLSTASEEEQKAAARELYDFRLKHRLDLNIHWELMMYLENSYEDNAGLKRLLGTETEKQREFRLKTAETIRAHRTDTEAPLR